MINLRLFLESNYKKLYKPLILLMQLINAAFVIIQAFSISAVVDVVFIRHKPFIDAMAYVIVFAVNAALRCLLNFISELFIQNFSEDIKENIKEKSLKALLSSNPYKVKQQKLGEVINMLTEGMEMITPYYSQYIPQLFAAAIIPITIFITVLFVDKLSAVIMIITYPLIPIFMMLIGYKSKALNEKQWKKLSILSSHFIDMLQGISTLKVFGRSRLQEEKVYNISENYREATMQVLRVSFLSALVLELSSTISTALIAVDLGLRLVYDKISFLNAFFVLVLTPDFYLPVRNLGLRFHASLNGNVAIEKIDELIAKVKYEEGVDGSLELEKGSFQLEVRNLSFSYEDKIALKNISFKLDKGEKLALVGESGSGKSTLINILLGFIKVDNGMVFINGKDINSLNRAELLGRMALVPQFPHIFNKSIEENIILGQKQAEAKALEELLRITKVDVLKKKFKEGYKALVGEGDIALSGGEVQRIALARALIKKPGLTILDEPSSALDAISEGLFDEVMTNSLKDTSTIIAAHRLNTIKKVDKIIVLHQGELVEEGSHEELMKNHYKYYELVKTLEV